MEATWRYWDALEFLASEFGNTAYQELAPGPVVQRNSRGRRVFGELHTADLLHHLQQMMAQVFGRGQEELAIAALQFYSDRTLLNVKRQQAHPMRWVHHITSEFCGCVLR